MFNKIIPTNLITGFLGVGKTTAIRHLLEQKPDSERWAVLVNEFGEVGIDGALLEQNEGVTIKEIPGGCMCCVAGVPTQVGLLQLIRKAKPDRLLIEPTGLGHPDEVIKTLRGEMFRSVLELQAVITLVDPRKLDDNRYRDNPTFIDQAAVADRLVANKVDLCSDEQLQQFNLWCQEFSAPVTSQVSQGQLSLDWLQQQHGGGKSRTPQYHLAAKQAQAVDIGSDLNSDFDRLELSADEEYLCRENSGSGFYSCGWIFAPRNYFNYDQLLNLFSGVSSARLKAVMITDMGVFAFNSEEGLMSIQELDDTFDSRVELIDSQPLVKEDFQQQLLAAIEGDF